MNPENSGKNTCGILIYHLLLLIVFVLLLVLHRGILVYFLPPSLFSLLSLQPISI